MSTHILKRSLAPILYCLLTLLLSVANAAQVYTWKDSEGVTHYSQKPPRDAAVEPSAIEVPTAPAERATRDDDYFSVIRQAERMETRRLENERLRAERLKAEAEAKKARAEAWAASQPYMPSDSWDSNRYIPAAPIYGYQPGFGHRPCHRRDRDCGYRPGSGLRPGHGYFPGRPVNRPGTGSIPLPIRPTYRSAPRRAISAATPVAPVTMPHAAVR